MESIVCIHSPLVHGLYKYKHDIMIIIAYIPICNRMQYIRRFRNKLIWIAYACVIHILEYQMKLIYIILHYWK